MGSSSYITNLDAQIVQHVEYVPFGEVFIEERNQSWNTPYLFNGKELDEETGLSYYGARYYNPKESVWLSVDPLAEKYPNVSPYTYTFQNPIKFIDPTEMMPEDGDGLGDPPEKRRTDVYTSSSIKGGGRKLTETGSYSGVTNSGCYESFVNVVDKDGYSVKAYSGTDAVSDYVKTYGHPKKVETVMFDRLNRFERTLYAIKDVSYVAITEPDSQAVLLMPLGVLMDVMLAGSVVEGTAIVNASKAESLGASRTAAKEWLKNAGNLERNQLIREIGDAEFKKVSPSNSPSLHYQRGGVKLRLDGDQMQIHHLIICTLIMGEIKELTI
ncbi:RHS repeat domain-containing protein [Apibacter adventoris]|uniref:RHS repeat domain-containing protein n=1 Tax=Apibacter adventoris TaxID=1679466 RepID=UPI0015E2E402|nr:RHS repeat-associated core domain-containing protein [Apibacter adventoris]